MAGEPVFAASPATLVQLLEFRLDRLCPKAHSPIQLGATSSSSCLRAALNSPRHRDTYPCLHCHHRRGRRRRKPVRGDHDPRAVLQLEGRARARRWVKPGPLPAELLVPYPAEPMAAWQVSDDAKNSRIEPHAGMAEPVPRL
jgi:hypothetical protein